MNTSLSTAASANCYAAAIVEIFCYLVSLRGVTIPDAVNASLIVIVGGAIHWLTSRDRPPAAGLAVTNGETK